MFITTGLRKNKVDDQCEGGIQMNVYSVKDVSTHLKLKPATLRKYCGMMEKGGYSFDRNAQGHRFFHDKDVIAVRTIIQSKDNGVTLEEAIKGVVNQAQYITETNETNLPQERNESAIRGNSDIEELKSLILQQNELIINLNERMKSMEKQYNDQQQILLEELKSDTENKSWLRNLFSKNRSFYRQEPNALYIRR